MSLWGAHFPTTFESVKVITPMMYAGKNYVRRYNKKMLGDRRTNSQVR